MMLKDNIQVVKYPMDIHPGNKSNSILKSNLHQGNIYKNLEDLDKLEKDSTTDTSTMFSLGNQECQQTTRLYWLNSRKTGSEGTADITREGTYGPL